MGVRCERTTPRSVNVVEAGAEVVEAVKVVEGGVEMAEGEDMGGGTEMMDVEAAGVVTGNLNPEPLPGDEWALNGGGFSIVLKVASVAIDGRVKFTSGTIIRSDILVRRTDRWQLVRRQGFVTPDLRPCLET
jgi:hypothetical protein